LLDFDKRLEQRLVELRRAEVCDANGQLRTRIDEVMEDNRSAAFVPELFGPEILAKRLDAEHGTVVPTSTVASGLLEKPLELVQAPALAWVEWTHQHEQQRRALGLFAQRLRERLTGDEDAIVEEDLDFGA
jgi:hypothetical protein